jgi:hypothetical protein
MTKTKKIQGQATSEQIAEWKKKHTDIFELGTSEKVCYLKKPGRKELSMASMVSGEDPFKWNEAIIESCWLGGDEEIKTNDDLFLAVSRQLTELVRVQDSYIKKL